ncbi:hypothetical protein [Marinagarivorans algicola]|uniref:hypothetical protein n=1 Tax=Marinagarivorans algicola TaxID=1513270 RepID=UPI00373695DB
MNELNRMQYLDAMGIEMFVPRKILPAAKMSTACAVSYLSQAQDSALTGGMQALAVSAQAQLAPPHATGMAEAPEIASSAATREIVTDWLAPSKAANAKHETPVQDSTVQDNTPAERTLQQVVSQKKPQLLRFNLGLWQLANGALFIDTREPRAALPTTTLLRNIIAAIMPAMLAEGLPKADTINWPLLESPIANPNELAQAREMTHAFLASRFEKTSPKLMIVMGEQAFDIVAASQGMTTPKYGESVSPTHLPSPVVYLPSLTQLLNEPLLKRFVWPAIAPYFLESKPKGRQ